MIELTYSEIVMLMAEQRRKKPRSIELKFGRNGPTEKELEEYNLEVKNYNRDYRKLTKLLKTAKQ